MLLDLRSDDPGRLDGDVAIIGAGAAGITMARRLAAAGLHVLLLESGGFDWEAQTADLNSGRNVGEPYYDLEDSRLRFFGGTTAIWGGRCAELDPIDFERRDWVPHSGWPIDRETLAPWYAQARALLGLPESRPDYPPPPPLDSLGEGLAVGHWEFDEQFDRFGAERNRDLLAHPRVTVVVHATVREIVAEPSLEAIARLDVRALGGRRLEVRAGTYVLAAGGLENPRLLLASNSIAPAGLGNGRGLVGRFFMEHPHARGGRLVGGPTWALLRAFRHRRVGETPVAPLIAAAPDLQRRDGLLNSVLTIAARPPAGGSPPLLKRAYLLARHKASPTRTGRGLWKAYRRAGRGLKRLLGPIGPWRRCLAGQMELALVVRAEQSPNPDSRVTLDTTTDALGMPRIRLDWRLQQLDVHTVSGLVDRLAAEAERTGLGRIDKAAWLAEGAWVTDPLVSAHPIGGFHHMGTTRMADDPALGVTDGFGRVHGIANLYVAGSSLFPTGGWANPTLTILALALRSADRIAGGHRS